MNDRSHSTPREAVPAAFQGAVGVVRAAQEYRLVALQPIGAGQRLFRIEGDLTSQPSRYSVQVDESLHVDLRPGHSAEEILDRYFWRFMNHHCEPNTAIRGRDVVSLRAIAAWEDVTFDYNATEYDMANPFACRCGSPACLGTIRGFRHLNATQRQRIRAHLAPHLQRRLEPAPDPLPGVVTSWMPA